MGRGTRVLWRIALTLTAIAAYAVAVTFAWALIVSGRTQLRTDSAFNRLTAAIETGVVDDKTGLVARSVCGFTPAAQSYELDREEIISVSHCLERHGLLSATDISEIEGDGSFTSFQMECHSDRQEGDTQLLAGCGFTSGGAVVASWRGARPVTYGVASLSGLVLVAWLIGIRLPLKMAGIVAGVAAIATIALLVSFSLIG